MAQVRIFQGGQVALDPRVSERFRAADFGPGAAAVGLKKAGDALGQFAQRQDEIDDVKAKLEANRLAVEHGERAKQIGRRVKQTLGEGAEAAADEGITELGKSTSELLERASPRARQMLETDLQARNSTFSDSWQDHGFGETKTAFETSSLARRQSVVELALDEDDDEKALPMLAEAGAINAERARFFGQSDDWVHAENRKVQSDFIKARAVRLAAGSGGAQAAIDYANRFRSNLSADDYNSIVNTYDDEALKDAAANEINGAPQAVSSVVEVTPTEQPDAAPVRQLDPRALWEAHIKPWEGGAAIVVDSNGTKSKFGINQAANPDLDVPNLTEAQAFERYRKNYYLKSGADKLPPALAAVHTDTFYLNEREAGRILKQSGGDVDRYVELRRSFLNGLAARDPAKFGKYKKGWENRTAALARFADQQGGSVGVPVQPGAPIGDVREMIFSRTDISMRYKRALFDAYRERQSMADSDRARRESEADRVLTEAVAGLGESYTSPSQLPQEALLQASPNQRLALATQARTNVQRKDTPPEVERDISFVELANPERYASEGFITELRRRGASESTIRNVMARQGQIRAGLLNPKSADPIADGSLWAVAKPAFEAQGLFLDTIEGDGKRKGASARAEERKADSARQMRAVEFLRGNMTRWMASNPGKKPDEQTIRTWVGYALRADKSGSGKRLFEFDDRETYGAIAQRDRVAIQQEFIRRDPNWVRKPVGERIRDVADAFRSNLARGTVR